MINLNILLKKLKLYECDDNTVTWFKSYLTERKQCVINENYKSEMKETTHGVPQGSILGPRLNHHYNLRSSGFNLMVQKPKTEMLRKCFSYSGPVTWNSLLEYIKEHVHSSLSVFKYHLKKYFNEN